MPNQRVEEEAAQSRAPIATCIYMYNCIYLMVNCRRLPRCIQLLFNKPN